MFISKGFLAITITLVITLTMEQLIPRIFFIDFNFPLGPKLTFTIMTLVALVLQYPILYFLISMQTHENKLRSISIISVQSIITILMIIVAFEVIINNNFYRFPYLNYIISGVITTSYGITVFSLGFLAYRFLRFHNTNIGIIGLLYGLAFSSLTINAIIHYLSVSIRLGHFLFLRIPLPEHCLQFEMPPSCSEIQSSLAITWIVSFLLVWTSSIMFNYRNRSDIGKKFWILTLLPVTFLLYYPISFIAIPLLNNLGVTIVSIVHIVNYLFPTLYLVSTIIPAFAFGASFWIQRKNITDIKNRIFYVAGGIGLFLYFLSINPFVFPQSGTFGFLSKMPYGIVLLSLAGLFAYMICTSRIDKLVTNKEIT